MLKQLKEDIQAVFARDPAARNTKNDKQFNMQ
jgi:hypothetical protein